MATFTSTGKKITNEPRKVKYAYTTTGGERVTKYNDGTENRVAKKSAPTQQSGIVSSSSVINDKNKSNARIQAGAALTSDAGVYSPMNTEYMNMLTRNEDEYRSDQQKMANVVGLKFDAALRRSNQQYGALISDLESNLSNDLALAENQAAALNPYSEAQGAMTARNFQGKVRSEYQKQALRVQQQAEAAEEALRVGETEAYMEISNSMKESNRQFQKNMMDFMINAQETANRNSQWQQEFGLKQQSFNLESSLAYSGEYNDFVENFASDPAFQSEIDNYFATGQLTESLKPLVEKGRMNGMSIDQALGVAQYKTQAQRELELEQKQFEQQMALGWYNAQTSRLNATQRETETQSTIPPELKQSLLQMLSSKGITKQRREDIIDLVETGGTEAAYTWVYNNMFSAEQRKDFDSYQTAIPVIENALQTIEQDETSFGPYKNLFESAAPWLLMKRDPKYAQIRSEIENAQSEIRRALYGTAVTAAEKGTAENFLIKDSDSAEIIKVKLEGLSAIAAYTNDVKRATPLGLEKTISLKNYLPEETPEEKVSGNVTWGIGGAKGNPAVNDYLNSLNIQR